MQIKMALHINQVVKTINKQTRVKKDHLSMTVPYGKSSSSKIQSKYCQNAKFWAKRFEFSPIGATLVKPGALSRKF